MIIECCICKDYRDAHNNWYSPTEIERRTEYLHDNHISHSYCPPCALVMFRKEGFTKNEIEKILEDLE